MKQLLYTLLLSVFFFSCSDDEDKTLDKDISGNFKTVKVVLTRTSANYSLFTGGTILTIPANKSESQYNAKDFDSVLGDEDNLMLAKLNNTLSAKQEFTIKQKSVKIQVVDTPQLLDSVDPDNDKFDLTTKIQVYVNNKLVAESETYVFSEFSIPNMFYYEE